VTFAPRSANALHIRSTAGFRLGVIGIDFNKLREVCTTAKNEVYRVTIGSEAIGCDLEIALCRSVNLLSEDRVISIIALSKMPRKDLGHYR